MSDFLAAVSDHHFNREPALDADVLVAIEDGELTQDQLRRLIAWEAGQMGLTFEQAVEQAEAGTLPRTVLGMDVDLLLRMFDPDGYQWDIDHPNGEISNEEDEAMTRYATEGRDR